MHKGKTLLTLALCLALLASCGSQVLITRPAQDLNLTAEDLGSGYTMSRDEGLDSFVQEMNVEDIDDISGASYRTFEGDSGTMVLSMAITLKGTATTGNLQILSAGFEQGLAESREGVILENLQAPALGDEAEMRYLNIADVGVSLYYLSFRRANAIGIVAVVGVKEAATEELTTELGQRLLAKFE